MISNELRTKIIDYIKSLHTDDIYRSCNYMGDEWITLPNEMKIGIEDQENDDGFENYFLELDGTKIQIDSELYLIASIANRGEDISGFASDQEKIFHDAIP